MALINCPECKAEVSDSAFKCLKCAYQLRKPKRGFMGEVFAQIFSAFNVLMFIVVIAAWVAHSEDAGGFGDLWDNVVQLRAAFASTKSALEFWALGSIIFGLLVWFNEPKEW